MWKLKDSNKIEINNETFEAICSLYFNRPLDYYIKEKDMYLRLIKHLDNNTLNSLWLCIKNSGDLSKIETRDLGSFEHSDILIMEEYYDVLKTYNNTLENIRL